jgi:hypothetical protein
MKERFFKMNISLFGIVVRLIVTISTIFVLTKYCLHLSNKDNIKKITGIIILIFALGVFWLADIEGATRLVFLGFEIDKRVEKAEDIIDRLDCVEKIAQDTKNNLQKIQKEALETTQNLSSLIDKENQIFEIQKLKYRAMDGDYDAYNSLRNYQSEDSDLLERVRAAVIEVKLSYIGTTRIKGMEIQRTKEDGTHIEEDDFETIWLIEDLKNHQNWMFRTKAANLLAKRKEIDVPEVLLEAMENDPNLWVRKEALDSFETVTGFIASDVFKFETGEPREWYLKNKDEVIKNLTNREQEKD